MIPAVGAYDMHDELDTESPLILSFSVTASRSTS